MLTDIPVLIVVDRAYLALDLADAVEQLNGLVIGPVGTVTDALQILDSQEVAAAILDYELPAGDAAPVVRALLRKNVPFVIHTGVPVSREILALRPKTPVLMQPVRPEDVATILAHEVIKAELIR